MNRSKKLILACALSGATDCVRGKDGIGHGVRPDFKRLVVDGFTFRACSGRDAIEQFDATGAELVVIDILLPDISGIKVLRHVHHSSPRTKIVVYTATYLDTPELNFIRSIGAVILTKGRTSPEQLADDVERLVQSRPTPSSSMDAQVG